MSYILENVPADPFLRDVYIFECQLDLDMKTIFLDYDAERVLEMFEKADDDDEKPKGIVGLIKRGLSAILSFIKGILNKVKEVITGKPSNKEGRFDKDPSKIASLCDRFIGDDINALNNFSSGKWGPEKLISYANKIVDEHGDLIKGVGAFVGPIAGMFGASQVNKYLNGWSERIQDTLDANSDRMADAYEKIARAKDPGNKRAAIDDAVQTVMADMQKHAKLGGNALTEWANKVYLTNKLRRDITRNAEELETPEGRRNAKRRRNEQIRQEKKKTGFLRKLSKNISKGTEENKRGADKLRSAREERKDQIKRTYWDQESPDETRSASKKKKEGENLAGRVSRLNNRAKNID